MSKNRLSPPASTAKLQRGPSPGFKDQRSGAMRRVGPLTPKEPPAKTPESHGESKSLYIRK